MEAAPEPDPLPFEEIHEHAEITVGPPSTSADGYSAHGTFTIPEGAEGKKLYGTCSLFLGVDDWGILEVKDSGGNVVAQVDLKENPQTAGEQGGHKYHTGTGGAQLPSGTYSWEVSQTNIDYNPASGNTSICNYSIDVVPTEPGGRKEPEPCPCEGDTCDNSGGNAELFLQSVNQLGQFQNSETLDLLQLGGVQRDGGKHGHADVLVLQLRSVPWTWGPSGRKGGTEG